MARAVWLALLRSCLLMVASAVTITSAFVPRRVAPIYGSCRSSSMFFRVNSSASSCGLRGVALPNPAFVPVSSTSTPAVCNDFRTCSHLSLPCSVAAVSIYAPASPMILAPGKRMDIKNFAARRAAPMPSPLTMFAVTPEAASIYIDTHRRDIK